MAIVDNVPPCTDKRRLGLIGNGISRSSAPRLHRLGGLLCRLEVTYDLIDLHDQDPALFDATF